MCTYYYLHYHHVAPCARAVEYEPRYSYCERSTIELTGPAGPGSSPLSAVSALSIGSSHTNNSEHQLVQQPCEDVRPAIEYSYTNSHSGVGDIAGSYNNLCAMGGCLISQHCTSGGCRLEDLGGKWTCCKCQRGGNTYSYCVHPMKKVPDTLCYHVVCQGCWPDA